jgi:hypothetical protein
LMFVMAPNWIETVCFFEPTEPQPHLPDPNHNAHSVFDASLHKW